MSLSNGNSTETEAGEVLKGLYGLTTSSVVPLLLLDSFMLGVTCACVPLGTYLLWSKPHFAGRALPISMLWLVLAAISTHWVFSLRQLMSFIGEQNPLGIPLTTGPLTVDPFSVSSIQELPSIAAWRDILPLVTETVLFGFSTLLFVLTVYILLRNSPDRRWRYGFKALIPMATLVMYTISLAHWAIFLANYVLNASDSAIDWNGILSSTQVALLVLFSSNAVMSDAVVIWRMCIVWDRKRSILILGAVLVASTVGLNIANIIGSAVLHSSWGSSGRFDAENVVEVYGQNPVGLAAVFVSLASNLCATAIVGSKAWLHRRQLAEFMQSHRDRRSLAVRVMEILVESGVFYTAIWALYCASFFRYIIVDYVYEAVGSGFIFSFTTTADHLNAAMAQITSIYPLAIFILVTLDKIHHSRGPELLSNILPPPDRDTSATVSIALEGGVEHRMILGSDFMHLRKEVHPEHDFGEGRGPIRMARKSTSRDMRAS